MECKSFIGFEFTSHTQICGSYIFHSAVGTLNLLEFLVVYLINFLLVFEAALHMGALYLQSQHLWPGSQQTFGERPPEQEKQPNLFIIGILSIRRMSTGKLLHPAWTSSALLQMKAQIVLGMFVLPFFKHMKKLMVYLWHSVKQVVILDGQSPNPYCWHQGTAVPTGISINPNLVNTDLPESKI